MKILLVRPKLPPRTLGLRHIMKCEPIELEYIAAGVPEHETRIVDEIMGDNLEKELRRFDPDIVGTSAYITGIDEVRRICRTARAHNPDILTVVGGVHATVIPDDYFHDEIDAIVRGLGVAPFRELVTHHADWQDLTHIPNLCLRGPDGFHSTPTVPPTQHDLDTLPLPRRDLVSRHARKYFYLHHRPVSLIQTSIGCPFHCTFCFCWRITGGVHLRRTVESVADELASIPTREVYIIDDTFLLEQDYLLELAAEIRRRGIDREYLVYGRSDFIAENEDVIREWSELGMKATILGLEYTTDSELDSVMKQASVESNNRALEILQRHRVDVYASLILSPKYGPEDFRRVQEYILEKGLFYIVLQCLTPLPGTSLYPEYRDSITVAPGSHPMWDLSHMLVPSRLPLRKFYRHMVRIYMRTAGNPFRAWKLKLRTAPPFFSWRTFNLLFRSYWVLGTILRAHKHNQFYKAENQ
ncbi:B12-binding domain-containing radical SAM protein [Gemmatimonadota bacterium]